MPLLKTSVLRIATPLEYWKIIKLKSLWTTRKALDNIFVERLWRTVKYKHIFLLRFDSMPELRDSHKICFGRYNKYRLHMSLNYSMPDDVCYVIL